MLTMTESECLEAIAEGSTFQAVIEDGFEIKIEDYGCFICTAIHDGHRLRASLAGNCLLTEAERRYEEDPYTGEMISAMPITLISLRSRYEYDLNRLPENCVYEEAWGKRVWRKPLSQAEKEISLERHHMFYRILGALIKKLETLHGSCLVYDLHAYNHLRHARGTPLFNIGTEQLDTNRWDRVIQHWIRSLARVKLPDLETRSAVNEVFWGRGYLATFIKQHFRHTLALPTEIKKVFMDEVSGDPEPRVLSELKAALETIFLANARFFSTEIKPESPLAQKPGAGIQD
ncbi:MAG: N-formylglutamate amidohydrolase [bacterium]